MRESRKRIVFIGIVLLVIAILTTTPIILPRMCPIEAVYLKSENGNSIFVNIEDGLPFRGPIPQERLYDENGKKISEKDLNNGDILNIYGDRAMDDSFPGKYDGITKIKRTENANQNYIEEYEHFLGEY